MVAAAQEEEVGRLQGRWRKWCRGRRRPAMVVAPREEDGKGGDQGRGRESVGGGVGRTARVSVRVGEQR